MNLPNNLAEAIQLLRTVMRHNPEMIFNYNQGELYAIVDFIRPEHPLFHDEIFPFLQDAADMDAPLFEHLSPENINSLISFQNVDDESIPVIMYHIEQYLRRTRSPQFKKALKNIFGKLYSATISIPITKSKFLAG